MSGTGEPQGCIFCSAATETEQARLLLHRGRTSFILLNLYPYNSGHLMVVPNRHIACLADAQPDELNELMALTRLAEMALTEAYRPQGLNVGVNLGRSAGAGVVDHLHVHLVPRWTGDTNFMSAIGGVRVLPEELDQSADRLRPIFARLSTEENSRAAESGRTA